RDVLPRACPLCAARWHEPAARRRASGQGAGIRPPLRHDATGPGLRHRSPRADAGPHDCDDGVNAVCRSRLRRRLLNGTLECELDSVRYPLAVHHMRYGTEAQRNQLAFHIADNGEQLIERWDDWHLGMGATDHIPGMYYFSAGGDASRYGQIRAPLGLSLAASAYGSARHARYFAAQDTNSTTYIYRIIFRAGDTSARAEKFSADLATLHSTT